MFPANFVSVKRKQNRGLGNGCNFTPARVPVLGTLRCGSGHGLLHRRALEPNGWLIEVSQAEGAAPESASATSGLLVSGPSSRGWRLQSLPTLLLHPRSRTPLRPAKGSPLLRRQKLPPG